MEELQFTLGEGPCVESSGTGRPVLQPDLARTGPARWPGFSAAALEAGIGAVFALPLRVGAIRLGVLDLYRDAVGGLSAESWPMPCRTPTRLPRSCCTCTPMDVQAVRSWGRCP